MGAGALFERPVGAPKIERPEGPGFDHLVVLMFENRSFDNIFGYLYGPHGTSVPAGQQFEGLGPGVANRSADGTQIPAHPYTGTTDDIYSEPRPNA